MIYNSEYILHKFCDRYNSFYNSQFFNQIIFIKTVIYNYICLVMFFMIIYISIIVILLPTDYFFLSLSRAQFI